LVHEDVNGQPEALQSALTSIECDRDHGRSRFALALLADWDRGVPMLERRSREPGLAGHNRIGCPCIILRTGALSRRLQSGQFVRRTSRTVSAQPFRCPPRRKDEAARQ